MSVAAVVTEPGRHAMVMPDCECGTCGPTWARRRGKSGRFTQPVTLVAALEKEDAAARPGMVERHRACLAEMVLAADGVIAATRGDDPGRPGVGLALVLFAGELASAVRPDEFRGELPAGLVAACEQEVTAATLAAAACLAGLVEMAQLLSALTG
jgi:hypothetical protein